MYTAFRINNFRCFKELTVEGLTRVNLIAGRNNAGKTALLEAFWLHSGPNLPDLGTRLQAFRGVLNADPAHLLYDLFYDFNPGSSVTLVGEGDWGKRSLKITSQPSNFSNGEETDFSFSDVLPSYPPGLPQPDTSDISSSVISLEYVDENEHKHSSFGRLVQSRGPVINLGPNMQMGMAAQGMASKQAKLPKRPSSIFMSARHRNEPQEDVVRFGEVELAGYSDRIVGCLKRVDPSINRLVTIAAPPAPMIYADVGMSRPIPIGFLGDAVGRLLSMALAFYSTQDGMILIDEIENGLHHSTLVEVWKDLLWLSHEFNVQVLATTHNLECMTAARDAFAMSGSQELSFCRLSRKEKVIVATNYPFDTLDFALDQEAEIR